MVSCVVELQCLHAQYEENLQIGMGELSDIQPGLETAGRLRDLECIVRIKGRKPAYRKFCESVSELLPNKVS